jgi:hypothetical protein
MRTAPSIASRASCRSPSRNPNPETSAVSFGTTNGSPPSGLTSATSRTVPSRRHEDHPRIEGDREVVLARTPGDDDRRSGREVNLKGREVGASMVIVACR